MKQRYSRDGSAGAPAAEEKKGEKQPKKSVREEPEADESLPDFLQDLDADDIIKIE